MKRILAAAVLSGWSVASLAGSVDGINTLSQTEFELISKDLMAAFSYKAGAPAEPLGITGFDVGVSVSSTKLESPAVWNDAMSGGGMTTLVVPKIYLQKGLPFDIDVGAYYFTVANSNLEAWGGEIKYAIVDGSMAMPAVAVRGSATSLFGADQFTLTTRAVDLSISKGILMFTPYAGVGRVWATNTLQGNAVGGGRSDVSLSENRTFIGVSFTPGIINMAVERDSVGGIASYNVKLGIAF
jgi:hypothetical protein